VKQDDILQEILAAVKVSPVAAFEALKSGKIANGYKLVELRLECPECHSAYQARVEYESWSALTSRFRFQHVEHCKLAEPVAQKPLWLAKEGDK
jgi:hypothetical protein